MIDRLRTVTKIIALFCSFLVTSVLLLGHCDRLDGPVAKAALRALNTGEFEVIQIWVGPGQESELRQVFEQARTLRNMRPEVKKIADRYFTETAVRLHRAAEGMPYEGLEPAGLPVPLDLEKADRALETGNLDPLISLLTDELEERVNQRFKAALDAAEDRDASVEAGRRWVDAYVKFIVYSHGLYQVIQAGPDHGIEQ